MKIVRSTKTSIKFANPGKRTRVSLFLDEYFRFVQDVVNLLWERLPEPIMPLLSPQILKQVPTTLSARAAQCAGKQASAIVRGTLTKNSRRKFTIKKLENEGRFKQARKLREILKVNESKKPVVTGRNAELDSRFVTIDMAPQNSFDAWLHLKGFEDKKRKLNIPIKISSHQKSLVSRGLSMKTGIRLSDDEVTFLFEGEPQTSYGTPGSSIGIDVGITTAFTVSDGTQSTKDIHGHDLTSIQKKLARKKKGSKAFKRAQAHRSNYIGWAVKKIGVEGVSEVLIENIKNFRRGKRNSRFIQGWVYQELFERIERRCEDWGVPVHKVDPSYTSQRCSCCGWTRERNRRGKLFKCDKCGFTADADLNGSLNISFNLLPHGRSRSDKASRQGFYWSCPNQEPIVPDVQKPSKEL